MKNTRLFFFCVGALVLTGLAGPLAVLAGQAWDTPGTDGIYLVVTTDPERAVAGLEPLGVRPLGPSIATFGVLVSADSAAHAHARERGAWLVPAKALAAICGQLPPSTFTSRKAI